MQQEHPSIVAQLSGVNGMNCYVTGERFKGLFARAHCHPYPGIGMKDDAFSIYITET